MADKFTAEKRSSIMSAVKGADTKPEMKVRSLAHRLGYRFRLHSRALPGVPDLVFAGKKKVIFVHGCFWHGHKDCKRSQRPTSNEKFWNEKLSRNIERDGQNINALEKLGWTICVIWECETKSEDVLKTQLEGFLSA